MFACLRCGARSAAIEANALNPLERKFLAFLGDFLADASTMLLVDNVLRELASATDSNLVNCFLEFLGRLSKTSSFATKAWVLAEEVAQQAGI